MQTEINININKLINLSYKFIYLSDQNQLFRGSK
jgi:hypothetical protein